jgi:DnaJ family protein C protein 7
LYCTERALSVACSCWQLKVSRAECLAHVGRLSEANEAASDLIRRADDGSGASVADAVYVRGLCLYLQDNMEKAFTHFQQVLRLVPDHERAKSTYKVSQKQISIACKGKM